MAAGSIKYSAGILAGFRHLLTNHEDVFVIGQGLWAPWYVGSSMTDLEKDYGKERLIDSPVSEQAVTGAAVGAALCGYRPVVVHPRMDFMLLASDQIVNQAAKWTHMFGGKPKVPVTFRGIVNRGGEQGAQHSQALHAWYAHIPGLRVVMPATANDARDLLIASVLSDDPVVYIDDRWLYDWEQDEKPVRMMDLAAEGPRKVKSGADCTLVASSFSTYLCLKAADELKGDGIDCEVIDLRVINPIKYDVVMESVQKTGRLCVVDGGWSTCGLAAEIIAGVAERAAPSTMLTAPARINIADAPAPTSAPLEAAYYPDEHDIAARIRKMFSS